MSDSNTAIDMCCFLFFICERFKQEKSQVQYKHVSFLFKLISCDETYSILIIYKPKKNKRTDITLTIQDQWKKKL